VLLVGFGVAAWVTVLGLAIVTCVVLAAWMTAAHHSDALAPAISTAVASWLLAQHCALTVPGGQISIMPLALTLLLGALLVRGGRQAGRLTQASTIRKAVAVALGVAVPYGVAGALLTRAVTHAGISADPVQGGVGPFVLALCCVLWGVLRESAAIAPLMASWPDPLHVALRAAGAAFCVLAATAGVGTAIALIGRGTRAAALGSSVHPGTSGTALLAGLSLAYLPNAVAFTASFAAGPGFAVGTGTSVSLFGVHLGAVPALPLFAPLPGTDTAPRIAWLLVIGVAIAGLMTGWLIARSPRDAGDRWWTQYAIPDVGIALIAAGICGLLTGGIGWLSGGSLGPGRMADVGPRSLFVGLATAAEVGVVASIVVLVASWRAQDPGNEEPYFPEPVQLAFDTGDVQLVKGDTEGSS
jgi:hypothetical protein